MKQMLHLLVPGLLGPIPSVAEIVPDQRWLPLEKQLFRARRETVAGYDYESSLLGLFDVDTAEGLPTAPYRRLANGGKADKCYWLQLNPVFLRPDQDRLLVFSSEDFDFSLQEAEVLASALSDYFSEEEWVIEVHDPHRWYLKLPADPHIKLAEFQQVLGRNMDPFLPKGEGAGKWRALLNEVQMFLFNHPLNEKREQEGRMPLNGVWFSGGGGLDPQQQTPFGWLAGDEALAIGLAKSHDLVTINRENFNATTIAGSDGLLIYDDLLKPVCNADPYRWVEMVSCFERWLIQLQKRMPMDRLTIALYPCDGERFILSSGFHWTPWQKPQPLISQLTKNRLSF